MTNNPRKNPRRLVLVLGDQLDAQASAFDGFNPERDAVWMGEVAEESTHVWSHKARITLFLSAMRHFRDALQKQGIIVHYRRLDAPENRGNLVSELKASIEELKPKRVILTQPGEWRVKSELENVSKGLKVPMEVRSDRHFFTTMRAFSQYAEKRKTLRMAYFYQKMRRKTGILMEGDAPIGGRWSYDKENRQGFGKTGPGRISPPKSFSPDKITSDVIALVKHRFADHPGSLDHFDWAVTPEDASQGLSDFLENRLPTFGDYQDAMWTGQTYLYHSRLSSALNLKLLDPHKVVASAEKAYQKDLAPLNSVEGFIRQILGWREYVRGIYWHYMPAYKTWNELNANMHLPWFYWTGETRMNCLRETIGQTLAHGYAHHIQRLMVTGLFALLMGVEPREVHKWYLAIYVDAIEWVELPNTLGMSQFADGGLMASKPYVASGNYIKRMSNYCGSCNYDPARALSEVACPFTTLYWDFLIRHAGALDKNPRMGLQLRNLDRLSKQRRRAIGAKAAKLRNELG